MGIYRQPVITVTVDGTPLTNVVSASVSLGLNAQIASAEIVMAVVPEILPWSTVVITLGANAASAATRFTGYFVEKRQQLYPLRCVLSCRGKLILASLHKQGMYSALTEQSGVCYEDLSFHNQGGITDEVMVSILLYYAGLGGTWVPPEPSPPDGPWTPLGAVAPMDGIGGTGKTLGLVGQDRVWDWHVGVSSLEYIRKLDEICLGYRTYDSFDGTIRRTQVVMIPSITAVATFIEHVDIARANEDTMFMEIGNRIVVTGFPGMNSEAPISYTIATTNPFLQTAGVPWYVTDTLGSAMIEKQNTSATGLSCEEVAEWLLEEKNRSREMVTFTTPRDDLITPGDTIIVNAPTRLGINSWRCWVENVTCGVDESGSFSQTLKCLTAWPFISLLEDGEFLLTEVGDFVESE